LILKLEEWISFGSTQQFQGFNSVGTHVTDSGNNMQSIILTCTKNLVQEFHKHLSLRTSAIEVVSHWLLLLPMQTMDHEV
jgi:hypothetical protein